MTSSTNCNGITHMSKRARRSTHDHWPYWQFMVMFPALSPQEFAVGAEQGLTSGLIWRFYRRSHTLDGKKRYIASQDVVKKNIIRYNQEVSSWSWKLIVSLSGAFLLCLLLPHYTKLQLLLCPLQSGETVTSKPNFQSYSTSEWNASWEKLIQL